MTCMRPKMPDDIAMSMGTGLMHKRSDVHEARKGLLKAMWEHSVAPRFSSKPIDMEDYFSDRGSVIFSDSNSPRGATPPSPPTPTNDFREELVTTSSLTKGEREYLEKLLQSEDLDSIRRASMRLSDRDLFPPAADPPEITHEPKAHRESDIQKHLFRLHEQTTMKPSDMLRRMSFSENQVPDPPGLKEKVNSITRDESWDMATDDGTDKQEEPTAGRWNPFVDVNSWIDGNEGVEVGNDGNPTLPTQTSNPFKILGTSARDTSCHPHVLSPPLMEGLQGFMPEKLHDYHYWLKFSLVRDGPSLMTLLRHVRASPYTILAIETTTGHVFGSFTSTPWRLMSKGFYGSKDCFVWRMRRSRSEPCESILERALGESKMDIFPFSYKNNSIQFCCPQRVAVGAGEVEGLGTEGGQHYGNAIRLNGTLTSGSTSTSETFRNPCLIHTDLQGEEFEVANIELWSLTPHTDIKSAETAEFNALFLEEGRVVDKNLNLLEILVGSPV